MTEITNFEEFTNAVQTALQEYFGKFMRVEIQKVNKTNGIVLTGITIADETTNIAPTIYLDEPYRLYETGTSFGEILEKMIVLYRENRPDESFDIEFFSEYEKVKTKLAVKLLNYDMNREFLEEIPYIRYLDLAIVCHCVIINDMIGTGSITIRKEHLSMWEITETELFADAMKNTPKIYPADLIDMRKVVDEMYEKKMEYGNLSMYILTNKARLNGAASILYPDILTDIAEYFEDDIYILPSSVHEVILLPGKYGTDEAYLSKMVQEVNATQLKQEEILSNHAYLYSRKREQLLSLPLIPE